MEAWEAEESKTNEPHKLSTLSSVHLQATYIVLNVLVI